jgi:hypothetical protein
MKIESVLSPMQTHRQSPGECQSVYLNADYLSESIPTNYDHPQETKRSWHKAKQEEKGIQSSIMRIWGLFAGNAMLPFCNI